MSVEIESTTLQLQAGRRTPGKVVAVHVNYTSRARERGRMPEFPSYFLKAPTSVSAAGQPIVRPRGCQLLAFEGEIVLVIGRRARQVPPEQAWPMSRQ